jgi:hypothetical protein
MVAAAVAVIAVLATLAGPYLRRIGRVRINGIAAELRQRLAQLALEDAVEFELPASCRM